MTVQYYVAAFDQAMWHCVYEHGWRPGVNGRDTGFADVKHALQYHRELRVGELFAVTSSIKKIGCSSVVTWHVMRGVPTGDLVAECEMTSVHFDLGARVSIPFTTEFGSIAV